jgi:hypothetical protein
MKKFYLIRIKVRQILHYYIRSLFQQPVGSSTDRAFCVRTNRHVFSFALQFCLRLLARGLVFSFCIRKAIFPPVLTTVFFSKKVKLARARLVVRIVELSDWEGNLLMILLSEENNDLGGTQPSDPSDFK